MLCARAARTALLRRPALLLVRQTPSAAALRIAASSPRPYSQASSIATPQPAELRSATEDLLLALDQAEAANLAAVPDVDEVEYELPSRPDDGLTAKETIDKLLLKPKPAPQYLNASFFLKRIGKCLMFGCNEEQVAVAARLVRQIAKDFPRLQMARSNAVVDPRAVYTERLDMTKRIELEPLSKTFGGIPRPFPLPKLVEVAVLRYLDYVASTSPSDVKAKWDQIQRMQRKAWKVDSHSLSHKPVSPLAIQNMQWPSTLRYDRTRKTQNISLYTRLESFTEMDRRVKFILDVALWSHSANAFLVNAKVTLVFLYPRKQLQGKSTRWFAEEMERMLNHATPEVWQEGRDLIDTIRILESQTWNRADAAEDLGSASSA
ncbi:hypothetical protein K456DRAFT_1722398 [Colletotrichum gloeosporioides 23]|nr:hypothetical protein K456DRAFT_1722398 [Colletotrichum gloeosporioides 23]